MRCRICDNRELKMIVSLGSSPLANNFVKAPGDKEQRFPLDLFFCPKCKLVQLGQVVHPDLMFKHYVYVAGTTDTFRKHFEEYAVSVTKQFKLKKDSLVIDIGSNDGLLLSYFNTKTMGVEPASNIVPIAIKAGVDTINNYWGEETVKRILAWKGYADVVTANNVFAHIDNIKEVTRNVKNAMKTNGVFIIECAYLPDMIRDMTFDMVYHEHLSYYSLTPLVTFFRKQGMTVFDVKHMDSHGGSIRVFVKKDEGEHMVKQSVRNMLDEEKGLGVNGFTMYKVFGEKIWNVKDRLIQELKGKNVVGYGAPAKGNTLLNYCGFSGDDIRYIVEDNPLKVGLFAPGTHIPIVSPKRLHEDKPDYILILAWNFKDEILRRTSWMQGVKFMVPLPFPHQV